MSDSTRLLWTIESAHRSLNDAIDTGDRRAVHDAAATISSCAAELDARECQGAWMVRAMAEKLTEVSFEAPDDTIRGGESLLSTFVPLLRSEVSRGSGN